MLHNFQLAAIVKQGAAVQLKRIPMHQALQQTLAATWGTQLDAFLDQAQEIAFDAGYQPEEHERFALYDFEPPNGLRTRPVRALAILIQSIRKRSSLLPSKASPGLPETTTATSWSCSRTSAAHTLSGREPSCFCETGLTKLPNVPGSRWTPNWLRFSS